MISFAYFATLALLLGSHVQAAEDQRDEEFCYYYGQCDSTSSTQDVIAGVRDYYACLQLCMDYTDDEGGFCHYFTHDYSLSGGVCYLYNNCPGIDGSCSTCVSGYYECPLLSCNNYQFECQGELVGADNAATHFECSTMCKESTDECNWYTFDFENELCLLFKTCDMQSCTSCVTGEVDCPVPEVPLVPYPPECEYTGQTLPYPDSCRKYYECLADGTWMTFDCCPGGVYDHSSNSTCVSEEVGSGLCNDGNDEGCVAVTTEESDTTSSPAAGVPTNSASEWPEGSYCIFAGAAGCPPGFDLNTGYIHAISVYDVTSDYILPATFGASNIQCHYPPCGSHGNYADLNLNICCK